MKDFLNTVIDNVPLPGLSTNLPGDIIYLNEEAINILGYSMHELIGKNISKAVSDVTFLKYLINTCSNSLDRKSSEFIFKNKSGEDIVVRVFPIKQPLITKGLSILSFFFIDETNLFYHKVRLDISGKMEALGILTTSILHEMATPLNTMRGRLELIHNNPYPQRENISKHLTCIGNQLDRLDGLTSKLLAYVKTKPTSSKKWYINRIIKNCIKLLETELNTKQIQLDICYSKSIFSQNEAINAYALEQIVINILLNAIQASPLMGIIRIHTLRSERKIHIFISDQGTGIESKLKNRIFEPFFSKKSSKERGLGLFIVKELTLRIKGHVRFRSRVNNGSVFMITIPV